MFAKQAFTALLALAAPLIARADVTPLQPAPGDSFNAGSQCLVTWEGDSDSSTVWKNMAIELMSGNNLAMVHITTVATNQDGTTNGQFTYTCPEVNPYSDIYFYQFTSPLATDKQWTTRFTIASPTGQSTTPPNATQPGSNDAIPWGVGALVDPSQAVAAPSFAGDDSGGSGGNSTTPSVGSSSASMVAASQTRASASMTTQLIQATAGSSTSSNVSQSNTTTTTTTSGASAHAPFDVRVWMCVASLVLTAFLK